MVAEQNEIANVVALQQGIPSRRLINFTTPRGRSNLKTRHLEETRDLLRKRRAAQDPRDLTRTPGQLHLRFGATGQRADVSFFSGSVGSPLGETMGLTHHALRAVGREVLPTRGLDFLLAQVALGENGRKLSDMSFAMFNQGNDEKDTPRMFRTVNMRDPVTGSTRRVIRSVHSTDYAPYDNLEFVEDLLSGGYGQFPVLQFTETDQTVRFRFLAGEIPEDDGKHVIMKDGGIPVPMFECWNSEVGQRAVTVRPGIFRLICLNGAHVIESGATWRWIHRGDRSRIQEGVRSCIGEAQIKASGLVQRYTEAIDVAIDDAYAWFQRAVKGEDITAGQTEAVKGALLDPTTTPGGRLASVVDAITLIAQDQSDELEQERLEMLGSKLLARGLAEALRTPDRVLVAA